MLRRAVSSHLRTRGLPAAVQRRGLAMGFGSTAGYVWAGALGVAGVGGLTYVARLGKNKSLKASEINDLEKIDSVTLEELRTHGVTLYRYLTCPFCGKVRAFLDLHKIPYKCVEVDPLFKGQMKGLNYSMVPYLKMHKDGADGETVDIADSYQIVSLIGKKLGKAEDGEEVTKWRKWTEERFVRYLTLNLNRTLTDAWNSSAYIDVAEEIPAVNRFLSKAVGAPVMYLIVQKFVTRPKLLKMGYDGGDERAALHSQLDMWINEGVAQNRFHGGDVPNNADTDVYGVINAIRGYPLYIDLLQNTKAKEWLARMDEACGREPWKA